MVGKEYIAFWNGIQIMSEYKIKDYLHILRISLSKIKEAEKAYKRDIDNSDLEAELDYHIFSFSQIIYTLKEYLRNKFVEKKSEIEKQFEKYKNLSNRWKHEVFNIRRNFKLDVGSDTSVEKKLPINNDFGFEDIPISDIFEGCLSDIEKYCEQFDDGV